MKYIALLLILSAVQFPHRTVTVDILEVNHFQGQTQIIAWEDREGPYDFPRDWKITPDGTFDGRAWHDKNGKTIIAREYRETVTERDPERAAFQWWRGQGETKRQGGIWRQ